MAERVLNDRDAWLYLMRRTCTRLCASANNCLAGAGLNMPQFNALSVINERGEITMGVLSKELGVTMGAGTNVMDKLVDAGCVDRRHNAEDRRVVKAVLTPEGREVLSKCTATLGEFWSGILNHIEPEKRSVFLETYRQVLDLLDKAGGKVKRCPGV